MDRETKAGLKAGLMTGLISALLASILFSMLKINLLTIFILFIVIMIYLTVAGLLLVVLEKRLGIALYMEGLLAMVILYMVSGLILLFVFEVNTFDRYSYIGILIWSGILTYFYERNAR